jgi:hypothetical protein
MADHTKYWASVTALCRSRIRGGVSGSLAPTHLHAYPRPSRHVAQGHRDWVIAAANIAKSVDASVPINTYSA